MFQWSGYRYPSCRGHGFFYRLSRSKISGTWYLTVGFSRCPQKSFNRWRLKSAQRSCFKYSCWYVLVNRLIVFEVYFVLAIFTSLLNDFELLFPPFLIIGRLSNALCPFEILKCMIWCQHVFLKDKVHELLRIWSVKSLTCSIALIKKISMQCSCAASYKLMPNFDTLL